jgi:hypothetical protein
MGSSGWRSPCRRARRGRRTTRASARGGGGWRRRRPAAETGAPCPSRIAGSRVACRRRELLLRARVDTSGQSSGTRILSPPRRHVHPWLHHPGLPPPLRSCPAHWPRPRGAAACCQGTAHADRQARTSTAQLGLGIGRNQCTSIRPTVSWSWRLR